jgi:hypothetical protein
MSSDLRNLVSDKMISYRTEQLVKITDKFINLEFVLITFHEYFNFGDDKTRIKKLEDEFHNTVSICLKFIKEHSDKLKNVDTTIREKALWYKKDNSDYSDKLNALILDVEKCLKVLITNILTLRNSKAHKYLLTPITSDNCDFLLSREYFKLYFPLTFFD